MEKQNNTENIKHQPILLNSIPSKDNSISSMKKFDEIVNLQNTTSTINKNLPWSKLSKLAKINKIQDYVETYSETNMLKQSEKTALHNYLRDCLDKKKLQRIKDVIYDKDTETIKDIPGLSFNGTSQKFTLRVREKKDSTLKNLTKIKQKPSKSKSKQKQKQLKKKTT